MNDVQKERLQAALSEARATRLMRFDRYRKLLALLPFENGSLIEGTHRILDADEDMSALEEGFMHQWAERGLDPRNGLVGIVFEDPVGVVAAHPVVTGDKSERRTWKAVYWWNGLKGKSVIVVPYTEDGRVLLVPSWRGPVAGRWELEFPGGGDLNATEEIEAVRTEMFEEAGYEILEFHRLGGEEHFVMDSSTNGTPQAVYAVRLGRHVGAHPEAGEILRPPVLLTRSELEDGFRRGYAMLPAYPGRKFHMLNGRNGIGAMLAITHGFVR